MKLVATVTVCALAAAGIHFAQQPDRAFLPFRHIVVDPSPQPPGPNQRFHGDCKGVGDMNGDGFPDVIFAGSEVAWYEWPTWKKHVVATTDSEFTTDMQIADVNGDGALDIVVPEGKEGLVWWFENPRRDGAPWPRHLVGKVGEFVHDVEVGDVDGDGRLDILARKRYTSLWMQQADGAFVEQRIPTAAESGEGSALADINRDGKLDIVQEGYWLEYPSWKRHEIAKGWPRQVGVTVADIDGDGRPDVLLAPAESRGKLSWFKQSADLAAGEWVEQVIDPDVDYVHTFKVADLNHEGRLEVVTAEMQQSSRRRVSVYYQVNSKTWKQQVLATTGSHNIRLADIGNDGDIDIVGSNWGGDWHPVELWENLLIDRRKLSMDTRWKYKQVDNKRESRAFGLAFGDVDGDGNTDIASGRYLYKGGKWDRVDLGPDVDAVLMLAGGIVAQALPDVYYLYPVDRAATRWERVKIGTAPATSHGNGQGYAVAKLDGGRDWALLSSAEGVFAFQPPANPRTGKWTRRQITNDSSEEGIGVGDIDGDGRSDIATSDKEGHTINWWRNPGGEGAWQKIRIGKTERWADRIAIADINGDGRPDVVVTEEIFYHPASVFWFENPKTPGGEWTKHTIVTQYTTNAMSLADVNGDGQMDVITGEHRGSRKLAWWENRNHGAEWIEHVIDTGKENHLGARAFRLRPNGPLAIAGIAWDTYRYLHLWTLE